VTLRQRVALAFVARGGDLLLVQRSASAPIYPGRWTTVAGSVEAGEPPPAAAWRALAAELPLPVTLVAAGLPLDFSDTIKKRTVAFRIHPFLFHLAGEEPADVMVGRWVAPDEIIMASATGETIPELDEALARVWDPPAALPPLYRDEARAIHADRQSSARALAVRAAALVAASAPPERVAALRPALARLVNAARAAARPGRDVPHELDLAARAEARAVASVAAGRRVAAIGPAPLPEDATRVPVESADLTVVAAEAVLPRGDVVAHAGAVAAAEKRPVIVCTDAWAAWPDDLPPPLENGLEIVPRELIARIIGAAN